MCSIFAVVAKKTKIDSGKCEHALSLSKSRGPDFSYSIATDNTYIGCNVLSITGTPKGRYYLQNNLFLAFNGETYVENNSHDLPDTHDIIRQFANNNVNDVLRQIDGMFGIVLYDTSSHVLHIARDVQGEKTLFVYDDNNFFIVSSTILSIEGFLGKLEIDYSLYYPYLFTRHFLTYNRTIYKHIYQVPPGKCIQYDTQRYTQRTSTFATLAELYDPDTVNHNSKRSYSDILEELDFLLDKNIKNMIPARKFCVSFSGGIDSTLIAAYVNKHTSDFLPIATNCLNKDYISSNLTNFQKYITPEIVTCNITEKEWYEAIWEAYNIIKMPLPSHNYCTKLLLSKYLAKKNIKVIMGGEGADELFGGYDFYQTIKENDTYNQSPYSRFIDHGFQVPAMKYKAIKKYLDSVWHYFFKLTKNTLLATSLSDTFLVIADDGLRNTDQICGHYGIEGRSPFMRINIIKFIINLPSKYKAGKPLLADLFKKYYPDIKLQPKQGFAGFPCETYKYFYKDKKDFEMLSLLKNNTFPDTAVNQWKMLNLQYFYESYNYRDISYIT